MSEKVKKAMSKEDRGREKMRQVERVVANLKAINRDDLRRIEDEYYFGAFHHDLITDQELDAKPMIFVVGQYSTGKTSFINQIIGEEYAGCHVGPEPTTDRFMACCHGEEKEVIQGNAVSVNQTLPFNGLTRFGQGFLNKFSASFTPSTVLERVTVVDTPGVLSGEKQRLNRNYDFSSVCRWFAERADLILLLFDAHKLDVSDEFKEIITGLKGLDNKVRCVLNKADQIDSERLVRVYGALMYNVGKILQTPEVIRVYIGSFWSAPLRHTDHKAIFDTDRAKLMEEIEHLPHAGASRKTDELVRRVRLVKVHACVLGHLREKMPYVWGTELRKQHLIRNLDQIFEEVQAKYGLSPGDFPNVEEFSSCLKTFDFRKLPKLEYAALETLQDLLDRKIPAAMDATAASASGPFVSEEARSIADAAGEAAESRVRSRPSSLLVLLSVIGLAFLVALGALVQSDHKAAVDLRRGFGGIYEAVTGAGSDLLESANGVGESIFTAPFDPAGVAAGGKKTSATRATSVKDAAPAGKASKPASSAKRTKVAPKPKVTIPAASDAPAISRVKGAAPTPAPGAATGDAAPDEGGVPPPKASLAADGASEIATSLVEDGKGAAEPDASEDSDADAPEEEEDEEEEEVAEEEHGEEEEEDEEEEEEDDESSSAIPSEEVPGEEAGDDEVDEVDSMDDTPDDDVDAIGDASADDDESEEEDEPEEEEDEDEELAADDAAPAEDASAADVDPVEEAKAAPTDEL